MAANDPEVLGNPLLVEWPEKEQRLFAPFLPDAIHWRIGSTTKDRKRGMALAYLDARDVMDRLDEVLGPPGWEARYHHLGDKTCCELSVYVGDRWVTKSNGCGDTDIESEKGAYSTAFKRAAVCWGVGRYLYDLGNVWVDLTGDRESPITENDLERLSGILRCSNAVQMAARAKDVRNLQKYRDEIPSRKYGRGPTDAFIKKIDQHLRSLPKLATPEQLKEIAYLIDRGGLSEQAPEAWCEKHGVETLEDLFEKAAEQMIMEGKATLRQRKAEQTKQMQQPKP
ncbi:Hypothetical protein PBC10988_23260 [Planctomycetales bacterium 10988]|nr:Hypothetical protein PBC10988_23260 [Planctomycetales bacterium 10988]